MKKFLIIFMILIASVAFASNTYYMHIDAEGYVLDITHIKTAAPGYEAIKIATKIPDDIMHGCYKFNRTTGKFALDEVKYKAYLEAQAAAEQAGE